jgi:PAS domain S-box-containing protein
MESIQLYQSALDGADDAICICDQQMRILYMNQAAEKLTGFSLARAEQKKAGKFLAF